MTEQKKHPIWAKLPAPIAALLDAPWQFSLFKAMSLIEKHWAMEGELEQGASQRVLVSTYKELGFPASDIRACELLLSQRGRLKLETAFLGLYGVDAPMPHYLLEQAANDEEMGARTRAFLDIFNHILYCQLYQSWKKSQINLAGVGARQFDQMVAAIYENSQGESSKLNLASANQTSAAGLQQVLRQGLKQPNLQIADNMVEWQEVTEKPPISAENSVTLGQDSLLGGQVLITGNRVQIDIGPLSEAQARALFPNGKEGKKMHKLLAWHTGSKMAWQVKILIEVKEQHPVPLGECELGISSCMGIVEAHIAQRNFLDSDYQS
ncbi:hypothetical protein N473_03360 [Pseudoalteromonas luteoviolacea CPMOR-1]|uniref:Type VI secretion protein n=1 Tax=Pseudoalteromonas luteoviolacea CPMOR-1 TaxID=1365248 RepID=A0A167ID45_9GAMM|nr:type VI secretion system baseplate subunit TssG [Pseudoalteromonas luteoviolacea]KZN59207.1 hypothetical protein N473_03360 [Pseudoalteromonas luteoviolacea CPMOR-1]